MITRYTNEPDNFRVRSTVGETHTHTHTHTLTHTHTHAMAEVKRTKRRRGGHPFTPDGKDF